VCSRPINDLYYRYILSLFCFCKMQYKLHDRFSYCKVIFAIKLKENPKDVP